MLCNQLTLRRVIHTSPRLQDLHWNFCPHAFMRPRKQSMHHVEVQALQHVMGLSMPSGMEHTP